MPKNVMKLLKPSPNYGRNDFDLSHRSIHTANYGELIPSLCVEIVPKDKIIVRVSDLVRAQPMVTSPFVRAKQHVDVWFVPYQLLWSRFNEFITDKDEPSSSSSKDRLFIPTMKLSDLQAAIGSWDDDSGIVDIHGRKPVDTICRNLELLGYPATHLLTNHNNPDSAHFPDFEVNMWRLLAYNLIWYREYRQQYYDDGKHLLPSAVSSMSNGAAWLFNLDALQCDTAVDANIVTGLGSGIGLDLLKSMIQPRYRCWKKDIYTGLMPDTQFGNVSVVDVPLTGSLLSTKLNYFALHNVSTDLSATGGNLNFTGTGSSNSPKYALGSTAPTGTDKTTHTLIDGTGNQAKPLVDVRFDSSNTPGFDILALRRSEAIQRWRENALRAGNQVQDNFEAHYGVKPRSHMECHPTHVASFDAPLNIGDINSQASTGQTENGLLGDVAGKGIMSFDGSDSFTFESSDFGVLIGMYSILPEAEYNANNLDRMNALLEREDYFFPEYENLGLEGVSKSVISCNTNVDGVLGFAPRYFGYKQKHDRVIGQFQYYQDYYGIFRQWCSPKYDVDDSVGQSALPLSTLYVNPGVFGVNFNVTDYLRVPQFLVDFYANVEAIRQMSVSGMPSY